MKRQGKVIAGIAAALVVVMSMVTLVAAASIRAEPPGPDAWVDNVPETLAGYKVIHVTTPATKDCAVEPRIILQTTQKSIHDYLAASDPLPALDAAQAIRGAPEKVGISFVGPNATKERILANNAKWNALWEPGECVPTNKSIKYTDTEDYDNDIENGRGWAIFQDTEADDYSNDNAHSVYVDAPSSIGNYQTYWSAVLLNVRTDGTGYSFIQTGLRFQGGGGYVDWTDEEHGLGPEGYDDVSYTAGNTYWFTITYTSSVWQVCAHDLTPDDYECKISDETTGDSLDEDRETSVWFENANEDTGWHSGFDNNIYVYDADIYQSGSRGDWSSEDRWTLHNCGSGEYPVGDAMVGTLKNQGNAYFDLDKVPIQCD